MKENELRNYLKQVNEKAKQEIQEKETNRVKNNSLKNLMDKRADWFSSKGMELDLEKATAQKGIVPIKEKLENGTYSKDFVRLQEVLRVKTNFKTAKGEVKPSDTIAYIDEKGLIKGIFYKTTSAKNRYFKGTETETTLKNAITENAETLKNL